MSPGPAKTGNAKDKGRGHDDEKEGERRRGPAERASEREWGETLRDGFMRVSVNDDRAGVIKKGNTRKSGHLTYKCTRVSFEIE